MIDKLILKKPASDISVDGISTQDEALREAKDNNWMLEDMKQAASSNGLRIFYLRENEARHIYKVEGREHINIVADAHGVVQTVILNPKNFDTWRELEEFLKALSVMYYSEDSELYELSSGNIAKDFVVKRIDYAVTLHEDYTSVRSSLYVRHKQNAEAYTTSSCREKATYYGTHPSKIIIYDERLANSRRRGTERETFRYSDGPLTKLERQERTAGKVKKVAGYSRELKFDDLPDHFRDIIEGNIDPMHHFQRMHIYVLGGNEVSGRAQRDKCYYLRGQLQQASYSHVRRELNRNNNFEAIYGPVMNKYVLPEEQQPSYQLRQELAEFMED